MMANNNTNWHALSDASFAEQIGLFLKDCRLKQNKTQQQIADAAGINRTTVVSLETGKSGTLTSLIQVLRALEQLHILEAFKIEQKLSPLQLAKIEKKKRQRASKASKP